MGYVLFFLFALAPVVGFYLLVWYEGKQGARVFAAEYRERLDRHIARIEFILAHVDLSAFAKEEMSRLVIRAGHDLARLSLIAVRSVERLLTRFVRYMRTQHLKDDYADRSRESAREFVKTLSHFKNHLEASRPARERTLGELLQ